MASIGIIISSLIVACTAMILIPQGYSLIEACLVGVAGVVSAALGGLIAFFITGGRL
jgi:hypothetical protein